MQTKKRAGSSAWVDPDDAPVLTDEEIAQADVYDGNRLVRRGRPPVGDRPKEAIKLRLAADVVDYFRSTGPGWQTRINAELERVVRRATASSRTVGVKRRSETAKPAPTKRPASVARLAGTKA
ncbi:MAG: BrnA antitoxin family protein [Bauldia sp.]|nr:BrnA antitoxin family protein [Bauldia sp.]